MTAGNQDERRTSENKKLLRIYLSALQLMVVLVFTLAVGLFIWISDPSYGFKKDQAISSAVKIFEEEDPDKVVDGIHLSTGLIMDENFPLIRANCTACHSGKIIAQNRATREGWKEIITWMQETQKLWDLGDNEDAILTYLAKHYAPEEGGRRKPLENIQWYEIHQ